MRKPAMVRINGPMPRGKLLPAQSVADPGARTFILIVTPTYNSEKFLDDTILSVVSQSGDFNLCYHVQDGGSSDATLAIVRRWERLLRSGDFPILCAGLLFSHDSARDTGMYQAINRGVAHARPDRPFLMGWINSDDRLAPGALAAVSGVYDQFHEISFTCARVSMIDRRGVITTINPPDLYDRQKLSEGRHDGRTCPLVMQEGTFWRSGLWDQVGGLDERFHLAGDWDLWRRFALHAPLCTIDSVLGFHRRHPGQLSADLGRYHAEIDAAERQPALLAPPLSSGTGEMLRFDIDRGRWIRRPRRASSLGAPMLHLEQEGAVATYRVEVTQGARMREGPYPEANLPGGMRWIDDISAAAVVSVPYPGLWRMHLRLRNWRPDLRLRVMRGSTTCLDVIPGPGEDSRDTLLSASLWLEGGSNVLRIEADKQSGSLAGWLFILLEWYVVAPAADQAHLLAQINDARLPDPMSDWPSISVVVCAGDQTRLDLSLDAVLTQGYPDVEICVVHDASSDVNQQVLAAYSPVVDHVVPVGGEHRNVAVGRAVDCATGALIAVLDHTAILAPGALFALAAALRRGDGFDLAVGIDIEEADATLLGRRMPCLPEGRLSWHDMLRFGLQPASAQLFDRAALFFTRRVWQAAGGYLMSARARCAAFDFWVRCAKAGAASRTLSVDLVRRSVDAAAWPEADFADVRRHAEALAREEGLSLGRPTGVAARPVLKILLLDGERLGDRPSDGCRRLATALASANQRVVCLIDDIAAARGEQHTDMIESLFQASSAERADLVVIYGTQPSERCREFVARLVARNIPTVITGERRPSADGASSSGPGSDAPSASHAQRRPTDPALVRPYGVLVYGQWAAGARDALDGQSVQTLGGIKVGVDLSIYRPDRRGQARQILDLPADAFIILVIANGPGTPPSRLEVAAKAYDAFDCVPKYLVLLGYDGDLPSTDAPIRRADDQGADDVNALFYAAADVVISLLGEEMEMPLAQAAASGTPAIVQGGDHARDGPQEGKFGLRLAEWTSPLLVRSLRKLQIDEALHRRLSKSGLAHARANHSLEACAWSFMTLLRTLAGFQKLGFPSECAFPVAARAFSLRSLHTPRARPFLAPDWQAIAPPSSRRDQTETDLASTGLELEGPTASFYLRARHSGPQRLHVRAASRNGTTAVAVTVNGKPCGTLEFAPRGDGFDSLSRRASIFQGVNRVDLSLGSGSGAPFAQLALRSLDLAAEMTQDNASAPSWQPLIGFAEVDQIDGRGPPAQWIDGPSATLRLWSDTTGPQHLRVFVRNYGEAQSVELAINDALIGDVVVPTNDFLLSVRIVLEVTVERGWNRVSLTTGTLALTGLGRGLVMVVTGACLTDVDDHSWADEDDPDLSIRR